MVAGTASPIILFDGVCSLCNRAVRVVLKRDKARAFRFAAMQSEAGRALLRECGLPERGVDYIVLVEGGRCHTKSDAVIRIATRLSPFWRCWALVARLVPRVLRDFKYGLIARWRYRLFGRRTTCMVPSPGVADRFL
jgi:predicted DCC family thiol-disulfide oxidoreductase YuxK